MGLRRALLVLLIANAVAASPALPQLLGDRVEANCSFVASGSVDNGGADNGTVAVLCGLPPDQVAGPVKLAASPSAMIATRSIRRPASRRFFALATGDTVSAAIDVQKQMVAFDAPGNRRRHPSSATSP